MNDYAKKTFTLELAKLEDYVAENTESTVNFIATEYPVKIAFTPREPDQTALYETGGSPLNLLVSVGIETEVTIEAKDAVPAAVLKKLISLSEKVANAYYQAYRESEGNI